MTTAMKRFFSFYYLLALCTIVHAQDVRDQQIDSNNVPAQKSWSMIQLERIPPGLMIPDPLYEIALFSKVHSSDEVTNMIDLMDLRRTPNGRVYVEIWGNDRSSIINAGQLEALGAVVTSKWRNLATAHVAPQGLIAFARNLPSGHRLLTAYVENRNDNGPAGMNSESYNLAGHLGAGIKIGLMDNGFSSDVDTVLFIIDNDAYPNTVSTTNHRDDQFNTGSDNHGTGCFEVIVDHAPAADYYLHRASSASEWGNAVSDLIAQNVDILSISMGRTNTGWNDDTGGFCQAVNTAADAGILVLTSNGNEALKHWQGPFIEGPINNAQHEWSVGTEIDTLTSSIADSAKVKIKMQWDSTSDDYTLFLFDVAMDTVLDVSAQNDNFEEINWMNVSGVSLNVGIKVKREVPSPPEFELFVKSQILSIVEAAGSIESPTNSSRELVVGIGAVGAVQYIFGAGTESIKDYSSQGPTNDGRQAPDFAALTDSPTICCSNFSGTSAATPNAVGAIAAFWSAHTYLSAEGVLMIIKRQAELYKDWGIPGPDNIYGHGGLYLKDYTPNTRYILKNSGNSTGTSTLPYSSIEQADQYAPMNSNVFFLGQIHVEPPPGTIIDTPMIYKSAVEDAVIE